MYEITTTAPGGKIEQFVGRCDDLATATDQARRQNKALVDIYIWEQVTPKTRLLAWYDLYANRAFAQGETQCDY